MLDIGDLDSLRKYLESTGRIATGEAIEMIPLTGGVSARTVLIHRPGEAGDWVIKQALPKLRVESDWFSDPTRIHREAEALRWLPRLAPPDAFTPLIFEDFQNHLLAMQAVSYPHENLKAFLLSGTAPRDRILNLIEQLGKLLSAIHRNSAEQRDEMLALFADQSFFESLRLEPYYLHTADRVLESREFLQHLVKDTRSRRVALVHGDFSPKNVLVRNEKVILLDHEVIHFGDPAFDIGFFLTHLLAKALHLPDQHADFANAASTFFKIYGDCEHEPRAVRHTLGCLLARVAGRSPLEYLTIEQRSSQQNAALKLMKNPSERVDDLIEDFLQCTKSPT